MPAAPLLPLEDERLAALAELDLINSHSGPEFDEFPVVASKVFGVPIAAVTLIGRDIQWFKSGIGLQGQSVPRTHSICEYAILQPSEILYVPDTKADPRFADNPAVTADGGIRSYAGVSIAGPSGLPVGALCVADTVPREFPSDKLEQLRYMAAGVESVIKLHAAREEHQRRSMTDKSTGLENDRSFDVRFEKLLAACHRDPRRRIALLSIHFDDLEAIDRLLGIRGAEQTRQEVARRLGAAVRPGDETFRVGKDEFRVILDQSANPVEAEAIEKQIRSTLAEPFLIDQRHVQLGASVTAAILPESADRLTVPVA